jgi:hypothetical protein
MRNEVDLCNCWDEGEFVKMKWEGEICSDNREVLQLRASQGFLERHVSFELNSKRRSPAKILPRR